MVVTVTLNTAVDRTLAAPDFRVGEVVSAALVAEQPAGKGVNVSRCLSSYGIESVVTGFVGSLEVPLFHGSFRQTKARSMLVPINGRTRVDTTVLDPKNGTETHIREKGFEVGENDLRRMAAVLEKNVDPGDIVAVCGSLPLGVSPGQLARLVALCIGKPAQVVVDTSGEALKAATGARPHLIKPNIAELESLVGMELDGVSEIAEAALSLTPGVGAVLVSLGKDGAMLVKGGNAWRAVCPLDQKRVANTVGCGDAAVAGFLAGMAQKKTDEETLRMAVAFGTAAALTPTAGTVCVKDIVDLLKLATVERVI